MEYEQKRTPDLLMGGFIVTQIILSIILLGAFFSFDKSNTITRDGDTAPKIAIDNLDIIEQKLSDNDKRRIQNELLQKVKNNAESISLRTRASINADSLKTVRFDKINLNYVSSIIEIPDLKQEYRIFFEYSDDENNSYLTPNETLIIVCPDEDDNYKKYDFNCKDASGKNIYERMAAKYLNYFNFSGFTASINIKKDIKKVNIASMYGTKNAANYEQQCRAAISELGINPDRFQYYMLGDNDLTYTYEEE